MLRFLKSLSVIFIALVIFLAGIVVGSVLEQVNTQAKIDQALTFCQFDLGVQKTLAQSWESLAKGGTAIAEIMSKKYQACQATCGH